MNMFGRCAIVFGALVISALAASLVNAQEFPNDKAIGCHPYQEMVKYIEEQKEIPIFMGDAIQVEGTGILITVSQDQMTWTLYGHMPMQFPDGSVGMGMCVIGRGGSPEILLAMPPNNNGASQ